MIQRSAKPASVVSVPVEEMPPVVRRDLIVLLGKIPGVGGGPVVGPSFVEGAALIVAERHVRSRIEQERVGVLVPDDVGVLRIVDSSRAEPDQVLTRREVRFVVRSPLRIDAHGHLFDRKADVERLDIALALVDVVIGHDGLEGIVRARVGEGVRCRLGGRDVAVRRSVDVDVRPFEAIEPIRSVGYVTEVDSEELIRQEGVVRVIVVYEGASVLDAGRGYWIGIEDPSRSIDALELRCKLRRRGGRLCRRQIRRALRGPGVVERRQRYPAVRVQRDVEQPNDLAAVRIDQCLILHGQLGVHRGHPPGQAWRLGWVDDQLGFRGFQATRRGGLHDPSGPRGGNAGRRVEVSDGVEMRKVAVDDHGRLSLPVEAYLHLPAIYRHAGQHLPQPHVTRVAPVDHVLYGEVLPAFGYSVRLGGSLDVLHGGRARREPGRHAVIDAVSRSPDPIVYVDSPTGHPARTDVDQRVGRHHAIAHVGPQLLPRCIAERHVLRGRGIRKDAKEKDRQSEGN